MYMMWLTRNHLPPSSLLCNIPHFFADSRLKVTDNNPRGSGQLVAKDVKCCLLLFPLETLSIENIMDDCMPYLSGSALIDPCKRGPGTLYVVVIFACVLCMRLGDRCKQKYRTCERRSTPLMIADACIDLRCRPKQIEDEGKS
jgi:hypothetical protein